MTSSTIRTLSPCLICGDKSSGFNFGVLSCMACKAFFRRNAVKLGVGQFQIFPLIKRSFLFQNYEFTCKKDGDCPITYRHRRVCNCCRLARCFRVGMQKDLILSEDEKQTRRQIVAQNREKRENIQNAQSSDMV